jgi:acyl phosphate:glycerol-3-phosphate acyltransferase
MNATLEVALAFVAGYLVGSVPLGLLVARSAAGIDIRRYGTGNVGAANVRRNVGLLPAGMVALGIFLQGLLPAWVVHLLGGSEAAVGGAAIGAVVGYGWPVFLRFKGGRAVGTATGAAMAISVEGFVVLLLAYTLGALMKQVALGVLFGFVAYAAYVLYFATLLPDRIASLLLVILIVIRRLEGVRKDLEQGDPAAIIVDRLFFDRRLGQRLAGSIDEEHRGF